MDIPALDKAIFLIDRKDLDEQTNTSFSSYSQNDSIDVDNTDNVTDLKNKLKSSDRQMIVTTIQKMQILISKRLKEGTAEYNRLRGLKIAFVVDECHRAVSPATKRIIERFFGKVTLVWLYRNTTFSGESLSVDGGFATYNRGIIRSMSAQIYYPECYS